MSQSPQVVPHRSTPGQRPVYCPNRSIPEYSLTVRLLTESTRPTPFDSAPLSKCDYVGLISLRWTPHLGKLANLIMVPCDDVDATRADTAYPMTPRVWLMDFSVYSVKTVPLPRHRRHTPTARGMALPDATAGLRVRTRDTSIVDVMHASYHAAFTSYLAPKLCYVRTLASQRCHATSHGRHTDSRHVTEPKYK
ncbi:hypothetical protein SELMODRAFT_432087 [Selaginella moellendorffii]|uniref:Uncharacterized protein n=1 Tax=Selaginella moellendorffii TaxID=88036 RepID=D8TEY2_SELML|nr:hypothetical protein SELMODRAFT_432087 [Selaginella moellendorffii]